MMFNSFKINEKVIITGFGKCNGTIYKNRIATIICRDPYFLDYNIKLEDGTEDWIDGMYIKKIEGDKK